MCNSGEKVDPSEASFLKWTSQVGHTRSQTLTLELGVKFPVERVLNQASFKIILCFLSFSFFFFLI